MIPKEKAIQLVEQFKSEARADLYDEVFYAYDKKYGEGKRKFGKVADFSHEYHAKRCALIAVHEIIKSIPLSPTYEYNDGKVKYNLNSEDYWEQVKTEIEQL